MRLVKNLLHDLKMGNIEAPPCLLEFSNKEEEIHTTEKRRYSQGEKLENARGHGARQTQCQK